MGLMDKVKAQASSLAQSANAGMAKLDALPAQRRADTLLRTLGVAILAERTGRATSETSAQISQLLADLAQHEAQNSIDLVQQAAAQARAQQMQQQQSAMGMPGEFLTSAPPLDPNVSAPMPGGPGQGYGGGPGYGDQSPFGQPGGGPQPFGQPGGPTGFPGADQGPQPFGQPGGGPQSFGQPGGPTGFPGAEPVTGFPSENPIGFPAPAQDPEPEEGQGHSSFFPPATP